ncbi:MAG: DUF192 domain-containing protein [Deltaproteobacteria bacterium]|nr:DUF192 domain-containing protein [Deltaproteobacteria bacterium]
MYRVTRLKDSRVFADPCEVADSILTRFQGLMGKSGLDSGTGLLIEPCNSIHTFFMRFAIDVAYLARDAGNYRVLAIRRGMVPWRVDFPVFGARAVLELPKDGAAALNEGDLLCLS